jgi:hypothetical protein
MGVEARLKALSDAQRIDLRRRRDMCQGVMQASASFFAERARLQHTLDARKKRIGRREMLFLGAIVAGAILHWFLIRAIQLAPLTPTCRGERIDTHSGFRPRLSARLESVHGLVHR